jgi:hypothetical protein
MTALLAEIPDIQLRGPDGALYNSPLASDRFMSEKLWRIILIHGFRNSERDALESYNRFRDTLSKYSTFFATHLFYVVWPGDAFSWTTPQNYFSENVQTALAGARILARYLNKILTRESKEGTNCEWIIVSHSLGCRLTTEIIAELRRINSESCNKLRLVLMAGAVATIDVEDNDVYGTALLSAKYIANLYSPEDKTLRKWFPIGELDRLGVEAIGLNGGPIGFGWSVREQMRNFDHGDYWTKSSAVEFLAKLLGVAVPTTLPSYDMPNYHPPEYSGE